MRKLLTAASLKHTRLSAALLALTLATSGCAESPTFRHATYLGYAYEYDEASGMPVLDHNKPKHHDTLEVASQFMLSRDDVREPKRVRHDPSALFDNPFRGRNWR